MQIAGLVDILTRGCIVFHSRLILYIVVRIDSKDTIEKRVCYSIMFYKRM